MTRQQPTKRQVLDYVAEHGGDKAITRWGFPAIQAAMRPEPASDSVIVNAVMDSLIAAMRSGRIPLTYEVTEVDEDFLADQMAIWLPRSAEGCEENERMATLLSMISGCLHETGDERPATAWPEHIVPGFGLPYAMAEFDEDGNYHLVCPVCATKCYPDPRGLDRRDLTTAEDTITKGASHAYGIHFLVMAGRMCCPANTRQTGPAGVCETHDFGCPALGADRWFACGDKERAMWEDIDAARAGREQSWKAE